MIHEPLKLGAHDEIADGHARLIPGAILWPPLVLLELPLLTKPWGSHVSTRTLSARLHAAPAAPAGHRRPVKHRAMCTVMVERCADPTYIHRTVLGTRYAWHCVKNSSMAGRVFKTQVAG